MFWFEDPTTMLRWRKAARERLWIPQQIIRFLSYFWIHAYRFTTIFPPRVFGQSLSLDLFFFLGEWVCIHYAWWVCCISCIYYHLCIGRTWCLLVSRCSRNMRHVLQSVVPKKPKKSKSRNGGMVSGHRLHQCRSNDELSVRRATRNRPGLGPGQPCEGKTEQTERWNCCCAMFCGKYLSIGL